MLLMADTKIRFRELTWTQLGVQLQTFRWLDGHWKARQPDDPDWTFGEVLEHLSTCHDNLREQILVMAKAGYIELVNDPELLELIAEAGPVPNRVQPAIAV